MKKQLKTALDYNNGTGVLKEGDFRISASGLADYFSNTRQWFGDNLMDEKSFSGNNATLRGTAVHWILETYAKTQDFGPEEKQELENYIMKCTDPEYEDYIEDSDKENVNTQYKVMGQTAVNNYLQDNMPVCVEPFVTTEILPGIHAGGSIDALNNGHPMGDNDIESLRGTGGICITDYKSSSAKSLPDAINFKQRLQLLEYVYVLKKEYDITVDRIRIVYITTDDCGRISEKTQKPLKDYPSQVKVITENVFSHDIEYIEGILKLIADSVHRWNTVPADRYLLAQDHRLKLPENATANLFKK